MMTQKCRYHIISVNVVKIILKKTVQSGIDEFFFVTEAYEKKS